MANQNIFAPDGFFWWVGVVEDREDPLKVGRCRVRIIGYHPDDKEQIPTADLPWALPMQPITSAAISGKGSSPVGPLPGTWVIGFYADGRDMQQPVMMGTLGGVLGAAAGGEGGGTCGGAAATGTNSDPTATKTSDGQTVKDDKGAPVQQGNPTPPANQKADDNIRKIVKACIDAGIKDPRFLASIVGNVMKECGGVAQSENLGGYANTSNDRIRTIFGSRVTNYSDAQLNELKKDPVKWGDVIYGKDTSVGREFQHTEAGDGFKYRGRGFIQLTGKKYYAAASKAIGTDIVGSPDLANQPEVAAKTCAHIFKSQFGYGKSTTGIAYPGNSQNDADVLATSIIAGNDIRKKGAIGQEILGKVNKYSAQYAPGSAGGAMIQELLGGAAPPPSTPPSNKNQPDPKSTAPTDTMNDPSMGTPDAFSDPSSTYPSCDYENRAETNKLATGDTAGTVVEKINESVSTATRANGQGTWNEPRSAYCGKYPYVHMIESESGHIIEFDDTPGKERINIYHRAGTLIEIDANGTLHQRVAGDNYEVMVRNNRIYTKGKWDVTADGPTTLYINNTLDLDVGGEATVNIRNNASINIMGDASIGVGGNADLSVGGDFKLQAENIVMESNSDFHIKAGGALNVGAGGKLSLGAGGNVDIGGSNINADGGNINLNGGSASPTDPDSAGLSTPSTEVVSPGFAGFDDLQQPQCDPAVEKAQGNDDVHDRDTAIKNGEITAEQAAAADAKEAGGCKRSDTNAPATVAPTAYKRGEFASYREFPATIQLSQSIKLGDVAHNCGSSSAGKNKEFWGNSNIRDFNGISKSDLMDNLRGLAVNVLDPIKSKYPRVSFNSGMRVDIPPGGSATSQHMKGQAVDMDFGSHSANYEAALWIRDNVAYDQLLLEYKGSSCWVHVSFNPAGNRSGSAKVMTFLENKSIKPFLCDLG